MAFNLFSYKTTLLIMLAFATFSLNAKDLKFTDANGKVIYSNSDWDFSNANDYVCKYNKGDGVFVTFLTDENQIRVEHISAEMTTIIKIIDREKQLANVKKIVNNHIDEYNAEFNIDHTGINFVLKNPYEIEVITIFYNSMPTAGITNIPSESYASAYSNHNLVFGVPGAIQKYGTCRVQSQ